MKRRLTKTEEAEKAVETIGTIIFPYWKSSFPFYEYCSLGNGSAKTTVVKMKDTFSQKSFGANEVIVATTTIVSKEGAGGDSATYLPRQKNLKLDTGKAERILQRLQRNKDRKKSRRIRKVRTKSKKEKHGRRR